jgi:putative transferase (TIGR04331 family)
LKKHLVTTAVESSWPSKGQPILFLGEWCKRFNRKEKWNELDSNTVEYHWDDREKVYSDYQYLRELHEDMLVEMKDYLNDLHGVSRSLRYWRVQLGPWMGFFLPILFDRWSMLEKAQAEFDIVDFENPSYDVSEVIAEDTNHFFDLSLSDHWNQVIFSELASIFSFKKTRVRSPEFNQFFKRMRQNKKPINTSKSKMKNLISSLCQRCFEESDVFIYSSYLSPLNEIKLSLKLGQFPQFIRNRGADLSQILPQGRNSFNVTAAMSDFSEIASVMLKRHIPITYNEGYKSVLKVVENLRWPKRPKSILTAVEWFGNDVFKLWAGDKVENGSHLVIVQHGGNFGVAKWNFFEEHQVAISDKFLTWGWDDPKNKNIIAFGNVKALGSNQTFDESGGLLIIGLSMPLFSYHMYSVAISACQWTSYFNDQVTFVSSLNKKIRINTLFRMAAPDYGCGQEDRWKDIKNQPEIVVEDSSSRPLTDSISESRLVVSTYNATTFLETMAMDVPTVVFWNPEHWELRGAARSYFDDLREVGILHYSSESASRHVNNVWLDVGAWWKSEAVQKVRRKFCLRYSHIPVNGVDRIAEICRVDGLN